MRLGLVSLFTIAFGAIATASPPPPPPAYIVKLAETLAAPATATTLDALAHACGDDLKISVNGQADTRTGEQWLDEQRRLLGKVDRQALGYSPGYDSIMMFERVDDRSALPQTPGSLFDPRYVTRAVQYQFGADHLIHAIRILQGGVYVATPAR